VIKFKLAKKNKKSLTDFEWRVLRVVRTIPLGQTRSYSWVAKKAGRPRAQRAVGQALHKNPFPLLIPCHRVIAQGGGLGGFAFGVRVKKQLLLLEKNLISNFAKNYSRDAFFKVK
jgi:O-6-methylguanine DNA methyltransferase